MAEIGDTAMGHQIGKWKKHRFIFISCESCHEAFWVRFLNGKPLNTHCKCRYKGNHKDYRFIKLSPDNFFYSMVDKRGFIAVHRLIMAQHIGRCLHIWEIVHHINGDKTDNRIENLIIVGNDRHHQITILQNKIKYLEREIEKLKSKVK